MSAKLNYLLALTMLLPMLAMASTDSTTVCPEVRIEVEPKVYPPGVKVYARSRIPYKQTIHIYYKFIGERPETICS